MSQSDNQKLGGYAATSLGIGAIVGGGILLLVGPAFSVAGPAVFVSFAIDFSIAMATAFSMSRLIKLFPRSGGAYLWAKRLWSVDVAFPVGWLIWLSSVLAASLNAIGIGLFAIPVFENFQFEILNSFRFDQIISLCAIVLLTVLISVWGNRGNAKLNAIKLILFGAFLALGLWGAPFESFPIKNLSLSSSDSWNRIFLATALVFVAFQGFDVIANVAAKIRSPKVAGLAMFSSLATAMTCYLPLILLFCFSEFETHDQSTAFIGEIVSQFGGRTSWWLVVICGLLAMYLAVEANLVSASTVLESMARDGAMFTWISTSKKQEESDVKKSVLPVVFSGIVTLLLTLLLSDIESAASTASFAFVVLFGFANIACIFANLTMPSTKLELLISIYGAFGCIFVGIVLLHGSWIGPSVVAVSLVSGSLLYVFLLAGRARVKEVFDTTAPAIVTRAELALIPVSNPETAKQLIDFGSLFTNEKGKLILLSVLDSENKNDTIPLSFVMMPNVATALRAESLVVRAMPNECLWNTISDTASNHKIDTVVIGTSESVEESNEALTILLQNSNANVLLIRPGSKELSSKQKRVLVPISPYVANQVSRAKFLRSFLKNHTVAESDITFLRMYHSHSGVIGKRWQRFQNWTAKRTLESFAEDCGFDPSTVKLEPAIKFDDHLVGRSVGFDFIVLGLPPLRAGKKLITPLIQKLMSQNTEATIFLICSRG